MVIEQTLSVPNLPAVANSEIYEDRLSVLFLNSLEGGVEAATNYGVYPQLADWSSVAPPPFLTPVSWGTKMLPGAGAFCFVNHEDGSPTMDYLGSRIASQNPQSEI